MIKIRPSLLSALAPILLLCYQPASALMGGPVMPEYVQFEPSDAPDVVNLNTGDFSYTLPVGEVPGPYGNFPISMSYHAGIGPGQEATWVGLGWTLNPGAINRTLRGTPDDQFHGGDLAFIYAYSVTKGFSVSWTLSYGGIGLDMSYSSFSGYGLTASVSAQWYIFNGGVSFGTSGVGINGGVGYQGFGVNGNIGLHDGGISGGVTVGYTSPGGLTIGASVGVSYEYGGRVASNVGFSAGYQSPDGTTIGVGISSDGNVSINASKAGVNASVDLSSHGYSVGVSVGGTGLSVSQASSSSSHSHSNTASIAVPGLFSYSRSVYETWIRQASTEHTYGYMYQAGPALLVDGKSEDFNSSGGTGSNSQDWDWKFKGRSLDHVGDPSKGSLLPGYDVFSVASQGVSGAFRPFALTNHRILMSAEPLGKMTNDPDKDDPKPNTLFYLLEEDANPDDTKKRQLADEFSTKVDGQGRKVPQNYTRNAYDYCWDKDNSDPLNVRYFPNDAPADQEDKLQRVFNNECSRYAFFKSNHLNEGARLLYSASGENNLDFRKNYRSRMVFAFMGENGGYFQGDGNPDNGGIKRRRDELYASLMRKHVKDWKEWDGNQDPSLSWDYPVFGARRVEPILENNSNIGRLQGFKITNPDGTQYFFNQPVRSYMSASYTTNQKKGGPAFIDRVDPGANDTFMDLLRDMWGAYVRDPIGSIGELGKWAGKLVVGGISSFLFYSPQFTTACDPANNTSTLNYSYFMSTNPYATQWLLTEIRGPDFVEFNNSDMSKNFGYQVKLNYAKPVPYAWRAPYSPPGVDNDEVPNLLQPKSARTPDDCLAETYHASFGVKELVYLQSIETATHVASFVMNDPQSESRQDGKGWIFRWKGDYTPGAPKTSAGIPILVGTHFPVTRTWNGSSTRQTRDITIPGQNNQPPTKVASIVWYQRPVTYQIDNIYLDIQPTAEQIAHMLGKEILVTGMLTAQSNQTLKSKSAYNNGNLSIPVGYVMDALQEGGQNPVIPGGKGFHIKVRNIVPTHGKELEFGAYKVEFDPLTTGGPATISLSGIYYSDFDLYDNAGHSIQTWSTYTTAYTSDPDNSLTGLAQKESLKISSGGGDFQAASIQPLLAFNDFIDFNDWRGQDGSYPNEMRYLKRVDIADKFEMDKPFRRFIFDYDYSIHPRTLNSYALSYSDPDQFNRHAKSYPESPLGEDPTNPRKALGGKLKLKSVREVACGGLNCADSLSLPPFRFTYWFEDQSSFQAGSTREETVQLSTEVQDEWGFWNKHTAEGNNKAHQYFADYGGLAWGLRQIIDPAGGVMEVNYERDTYRGESYAEDELAIPISWDACPGTNPVKVCFDFLPRKWVKYCDRKDKLKGEWEYFVSAQDQSYQYMTDLGFVKNSELFFNVQQQGAAEVGCGLNLGFWKSNSCTRERSVSVVGSAKVDDVSPATTNRTYFDNVTYANENPTSTQLASHDWECNRNDGTCCPKIPFLDPASYTNYRSRYWYCKVSVTRVRTDLDYADMDRELQATYDKLSDRRWSRDGEQFGAVWSRQPSKILKGGDLRVKELVKRDIGMIQRTRYEYDPGEMAQYPDSIFSSGFAARFSTGKITGVLGDDMDPLWTDPQKKSFLLAHRDLPSKSRINGIGDDDVDLLPMASVTYPKVTMYNVIMDGNQEKIANGRSVFEFHGPEQRGSFEYKIVMTAPLISPEDHLRDLYVQFRDGSGNNIFAPQRLQVQDGESNSHYYSGSLVEYPPFKTSDIRSMVINYGDPKNSLSKIVVLDNSDAKSILNAEIAGTLTLPSNLQMTLQSFAKKDKDFDTNIMTAVPSNEKLVYEDRSSRIGKAKTTTYYRTIQGTNGDKEVLVKRDSMVYSDGATSVDDRFLGTGAGGASSSKVGVQEEEWTYDRKIKCGNHCTDGDNKIAWDPYTKLPAELKHRTVVHRRYPTFQTDSWSINGFNGARQPGQDLPANGPTDYLITHLANHRFDPILGKPTLTVAYSGRLLTSPSKATRITPAYTVDPDQNTNDLPNLFFVRNILETPFREDVFTWDVATTSNNKSNGTPLDFTSVDLKGTDPANGGVLASRLTAVKITPVTQALYNHGNLVDMRNPVVSRGEFQPRFNLQTSSGLTSENSAMLEAMPSLVNWSGSEITKVNRFLKTTEQKDANGVYLASRFDPLGFHQIGLFAPARYFETAVLTAEGYVHQFPFPLQDEKWEFPIGTNYTVDNDYVSVSANFIMRHRFDLKPAGGINKLLYAVEMQVLVDKPVDMQIGFMGIDGTISIQQTVHLAKGLQTLREVLDGYTLTDPLPPGQNRFFVSATDGTFKFKYIRVYPDDAQAKTFVYSARGKLIQSVDEANLSTYYEYDLLGNLVAVKDDNGIAYSSQKREMTNQ